MTQEPADRVGQEGEPWHRRHQHLLTVTATIVASLITLFGVIVFQAAATNSAAAATRRSADLLTLTSKTSICVQHYPKDQLPSACRDAANDLRQHP